MGSFAPTGCCRSLRRASARWMESRSFDRRNGQKEGRLKAQLGSLAAVAVVACALGGSIGAQEPAPAQQYAIPGHGRLLLSVPAGWRVLSQSLDKPPAVLLHFRPHAGDAFDVQVTSVWVDAAKRASLAPDSVKAGVQRTAAEALPKALEKAATIVELRGREAFGYYFSLTGQGSPVEAGDYRYLTHGTVVTGEVMTVFTILCRDPTPPEKEQGLRMLRDAAYAKAGPPDAGGASGS